MRPSTLGHMEKSLLGCGSYPADRTAFLCVSGLLSAWRSRLRLQGGGGGVDGFQVRTWGVSPKASNMLRLKTRQVSLIDSACIFFSC